MKRITASLLLLVSLMIIVCAGCGSSETTEEAAVSATMAPVEEAVEETAPEADAEPVEDTAEPKEGETEAAGAEDAYEVAMDMTGSPVADLIAAIGEPNGSEYTTSCLIPTGEDGLLYYDDFTVSTIKYPDGTELVMGAF